MEVIQNKGFLDSELVKINECRKYLQVLTLSDIMSGYGNSFTCSYNVQKDFTRKSIYNWPRTIWPGSTSIKVWRKALRKTFGLTAGTTTHELGPWLHNDLSNWLWFYNPPTQLIYQRFGVIWKVWQSSRRGGPLGRIPKFRYVTNALTKPLTCVRATIRKNTNNTINLTGWHTHHQDHNHLHHAKIGNVLESEILHQQGTTALLARKIESNEIIAVSDGSFDKEIMAGSAVWVFESRDKLDQIIWGAITPGHREIQSAYRSKLFGIMCILSTLLRICIDNNITQGAITIYCDRESAIHRAQENHETISNN